MFVKWIYEVEVIIITIPLCSSNAVTIVHYSGLITLISLNLFGYIINLG